MSLQQYCSVLSAPSSLPCVGASPSCRSTAAPYYISLLCIFSLRRSYLFLLSHLATSAPVAYYAWRLSPAARGHILIIQRLSCVLLPLSAAASAWASTSTPCESIRLCSSSPLATARVSSLSCAPAWIGLGSVVPQLRRRFAGGRVRFALACSSCR